jgi:hypothetical protein
MNVKIECPCGTRFAFEVEPVNGRMPVVVSCPSCGLDGTNAANAVIQRQLGVQPLAAPAEARPRIRLSGGAAPSVAPPSPPPPPVPVYSSVPSSDAGPALAEPAPSSDGAPAPETPAIELCPKHRTIPASEHCRVCGKPICAKCMELFGYVCSVYCQSQADKLGIEVPVFAGKKSTVQAREWRTMKLAAAGIAAVFVGLIGLYGWYYFVGSRPKTMFSIKVPKAERPGFAELLSLDEMVVLRGSKLSLFDLKGKELWTATVSGIKAPAPRESASVFDEYEPPPPEVRVIGEDIWIVLPDKLARFEKKTGKPKPEVPIKDSIGKVEFTDSSILVTAENPAGQKTLTHVALPAGTPRTETLAAPPVARFAARPAALAARTDPDDDAASSFSFGGREFIPAGPNVARFSSRLIEKRMVAVQAIKEAPKESGLNRTGLTARDSLKATIEELNSMQRESTGGVSYENESRYQVTLKRMLPADSPDWSGEVIGQPLFYALKSVDALVAGKTIHVFSKKNVKLWEGKLSYPVSDRVASSFGYSGEIAPCVEEAGTLYAFDKGMLTAFDARTGAARWRVPSVGISKVVRDSRGMLYVSTTSASPESIQYSQQIKAEKDKPVILKVDSSSGKVLWRSEGWGDTCLVSGKFVYVTSSQISGLDVIRAGGDDRNIPVHYRIYRLNTDTGNYLWEFYEQKAPKHLSIQQNRLALQFRDEIRVLGFRSM